MIEREIRASTQQLLSHGNAVYRPKAYNAELLQYMFEVMCSLIHD